MIVLHDFTPCVDDELEVKRGQIVIMLYQENDWVYVISVLDNSEGFIPFSYCTPLSSALAQIVDFKNKAPRIGVGGGSAVASLTANTFPGNTGEGSAVGTQVSMLSSNGLSRSSNVASINNCQTTATVHQEPDMEKNMKGMYIMDHQCLDRENKMYIDNVPDQGLLNNNKMLNQVHQFDGNHGSRGDIILEYNDAPLNQSEVSSSQQNQMHPFLKDSYGKYIVLYTFIARDENDLSVERGEFVTVLNREDPDWFWIVRSDSREGFVPSAFLCNPEVALLGNKAEQQPKVDNSESNKNSLMHPNNQNNNNKNQVIQQSHNKYGAPNNQRTSHHGSSSHNNHKPMPLTTSVITNGAHPLSSNNYKPTSLLSSCGKSAFTSNGLPATTANIYYNLLPMTNSSLVTNNNNLNNVHHNNHKNETVKQQPSQAMEESPTNSTLSTLPSGGVESSVSTVPSGDSHTGDSGISNSRYSGTELIMLYDYKAQAPDELTVMRGDWIYADLTNQSVQGWLWAHDPKLRKFGFIPKAYARRMASID